MALADAFLDQAGEDTTRPSPERLEEALREFDSAARAAWPDISLRAEAFVAHVAGHLTGEPDPLGALATLHAADLFLACACAQCTPSALAALESGFLSRVPRLVARVDASAPFADEVAQEIREAFLLPDHEGRARIASYSGRGPLANYLRVIALRIALRLRRERRAPPLRADGFCDTELAGPADPELDYLKLRYRGAYEQAFRAALAALPDRDRLLLRLQYVDALDIAAIGALYRMHRSTVIRWRASVRRELLESTRRRLRECVAVTDSEFDSLLHVVRSQMHVSLGQALGGGEAQ